MFAEDRHGFKKFGVFGNEREVAEQVWQQTGLAEGTRHPLAYVIEACDDIAYSVIDAEDIVKKRYASFNDLMDTLSGSSDPKVIEVSERAFKKNQEFRKADLSPPELDELSMQMFRVIAISVMIESATKTFVEHIDRILKCDAQKFEIIANSDVQDLCDRLKEFDRLKGFLHPDVLRVELKGHNYIRRVMDSIWFSINDRDGEDDQRTRFGNYTYSRISENYRRVYESTPCSKSDKLHLLCDAISGMTDSYLITLHDELEGLRGATGSEECK